MTERLTAALRSAAKAHGVHEEEEGKPDPDWPPWYAEHMTQTLAADGYQLSKSESH